MSNIVRFPTPPLTDEPVTVLIDGNVKAVKLFEALAKGGFNFTFDHVCCVLRISERRDG